ncbi:uncharacterized protein [Rutidosis leptorrhynchoides]|uniref:uncharacterized protein n=1 Tax=Rutidosis leptorrhynchoides TaxID=125765 RepID=UPI003A99E77C
MIKKARCRLKLLMNKRSSIVKHLRQDVALLIRDGHQECALKRAELLFKDENTMTAYELLDNFCEFIISNLSTIRKKREFSDDINEAVSTLIYASARCADMPELREIRKLFGERCGQDFAVAAIELLPGNLVNDQVKDRLSVNSVPDHVKYNLVYEIAKNHGICQDILAVQYASELQWVKENNSALQSTDEYISRYQIPSEESEIGVDDKDLTEDSDSLSTNKYLNNIRTMKSSSLENEIRRSDATSSSESLPRISDDKIVYIDDVEEIQPSMVTDIRDKRSFEFISSTTPEKENFDECEVDQYERSSTSSSGNGSPVYQAFTNKDGRPNNNEQKQGTKTLISTSGSGKYTIAPYSRAMTMPPERRKDAWKESNMVRACSLPVKNPNHVHPKLPEYDDLEAKFTALKKEFCITTPNSDGKSLV